MQRYTIKQTLGGSALCNEQGASLASFGNDAESLRLRALLVGAIARAANGGSVYDEATAQYVAGDLGQLDEESARPVADLISSAARIARNPSAFHPAPEIAADLEALLTQPAAFIARAESRHFSFEGHGRTETEANEALGRAFNEHARRYGLPADWWENGAGEMTTTPIEPGAAFRDGERL